MLSYEVKILGETWVCSCPDFENRADQIEMCKHAFAVKFWIASRVELQEQPKPKVFADDATQCPCGSIRVVKFGHANGKQIFKCRDCGRKFREGLIKKAHDIPQRRLPSPSTSTFRVLSLRKITRMVNDHFDMHLAKSTVYSLDSEVRPEDWRICQFPRSSVVGHMASGRVVCQDEGRGQGHPIQSEEYGLPLECDGQEDSVPTGLTTLYPTGT